MTITFYATMTVDHIRPYMANVPVLLPASSWVRVKMRRPNLPPQVQEVAADSGGFVATFRWGGEYRYTPQQYVDWLNTFTPSWAATMDFCCEPPITDGKADVVRERQQRTTEMAYRFWSDYRDTPWTWTPTVQGWNVEDYQRHAATLRPLIEKMKAHYSADPRFRVGIGTLCARANAAMVHRFVRAVAAELPGVPLHLWGVKLSVLKSHLALPQVVSVDSAAWIPGGLGRTGFEAKEERATLGLTQRQHAHLVALPRYLEKVERAINTPKQLPLL